MAPEHDVAVAGSRQFHVDRTPCLVLAVLMIWTREKSLLRIAMYVADTVEWCTQVHGDDR